MQATDERPASAALAPTSHSGRRQSARSKKHTDPFLALPDEQPSPSDKDGHGAGQSRSLLGDVRSLLVQPAIPWLMCLI